MADDKHAIEKALERWRIRRAVELNICVPENIEQHRVAIAHDAGRIDQDELAGRYLVTDQKRQVQHHAALCRHSRKDEGAAVVGHLRHSLEEMVVA
ncbi:hypothetical protein ACFX5Q_07410 [Mesorhizobium sp. IMUNJ 23033]|uniref:hypothetical protein n=1 Tax=Mesorhizobium sp. IMUNJ 23033 TaxID=3378039 RepID=UPI00384F6710